MLVLNVSMSIRRLIILNKPKSDAWQCRPCMLEEKAEYVAKFMTNRDKLVSYLEKDATRT